MPVTCVGEKRGAALFLFRFLDHVVRRKRDAVRSKLLVGSGMVRHISALLFVFAVLSGCSPAIARLSPPKVWERDGCVVLEGEINAESVDQVKARLATRQCLVLNSIGGQNDAALDLSAFVRANSLEVRVEGNCSSACAVYFLFPRLARVASENVVVLLHTSALSFDLRLRNDRSIPEIDREVSRRQAADLRALWQAEQADIGLLNCVDRLMEIRGNPIRQRSGPRPGEFILLGLYSPIIVSPAILERYGIDPTGIWFPRSEFERRWFAATDARVRGLRPRFADAPELCD